MNPEENVDLARFLAAAPKGSPPEASYRGACGRAYYSAFAVARDLLLLAKFQIATDGSAHSTIVRLLKESSSPSVKAAGGSLDQLRKTRNQADYDVGQRASPGIRFDANRAQLAVAYAKIIIESLKSARSTDIRIGIPDHVG